MGLFWGIKVERPSGHQEVNCNLLAPLAQESTCFALQRTLLCDSLHLTLHITLSSCSKSIHLSVIEHAVGFDKKNCILHVCKCTVAGAHVLSLEELDWDDWLSAYPSTYL